MCFATTSLVSYPTGFETLTVSGSTLTVYAGLTTATRTGCAASGSCNTCALDTTAVSANSVCSLNDINVNDTFPIVIKITGNTSLTTSAVGKVCLDTNCSSAMSSFTSYDTYAANSNLTLYPTWSQICGLAGATACAGSFDKTFYFGYKETSSSTLTEYVTVNIKFRYVDGTNTAFQKFDCTTVTPVTGEGFCYFDMYPGDKKAYIVPTFNPNNTSSVVANFADGTGGYDVSGMKYKYLRVLYILGTSGADDHSAHAGEFMQSNSAVNLGYEPSTGAVSPKKITGLTNGNTYLFFTASVDQAGIVTNYSDPSSLCQAPYTTADSYTSADTQCATPQRVSGLLDGKECFIATASYGSIMAPEVQTFRKFRSEFLLKSQIGKEFVRTYYRYSPPLADFISEHEWLRAPARMALFPALVFVKLSLAFGFLPALLLLMAMGTTLVIFIRRWQVRA